MRAYYALDTVPSTGELLKKADKFPAVQSRANKTRERLPCTEHA